MPLFIVHEELRYAKRSRTQATTYTVAADSLEDATAKIVARHKEVTGFEERPEETRTIRAMHVSGDIADYFQIQAEHEPFLMLLRGDRKAERELGYYCPVCKETRSDRRKRLEAERAARKKAKK